MILPGRAWAAHDAADVVRATGAVIDRLDLQLTLPKSATPSVWDFHLPSEVLWGALAIGVAVLAYSLSDLIPAFRRRRAGDWDGDDRAGETGAVTEAEALATADALAASGRYVEAMHTLLLVSLGELRRRLDTPFAASLTSREILRTAPLSQAGQAALAEIVDRVEHSYFGDRPATPDDYILCRERFDALARTLFAGRAA